VEENNAFSNARVETVREKIKFCHQSNAKLVQKPLVCVVAGSTTSWDGCPSIDVKDGGAIERTVMSSEFSVRKSEGVCAPTVS
jgi:hypothetical protein